VTKDKDVERFKRDAKAFGTSVAGHVPYIGEALGIYDTVQQGRRLAKSTPKAINALKRRTKSKVGRKLRRVRRYL
jgi:hypothetical protein